MARNDQAALTDTGTSDVDAPGPAMDKDVVSGEAVSPPAVEKGTGSADAVLVEP